MKRVDFILVAYHDQYRKPYHCTQHAKQQQKQYDEIEPFFPSFPLHRMGCQETLRSKFPLKQPPRLFLTAPILLLTAHAPILLKHANSPHAMTGNPAPIMAWPNHRIFFVNEHIQCTEKTLSEISRSAICARIFSRKW